MCGQLGIIFGTKRRRQEDIDHLTDIFTDLLVVSEARGRHASGIAWLKTDGDGKVFKLPVPASTLVCDPEYKSVLSQVDNSTTVLMGHTRWKTIGDERNNANNHPQVSDLCLGTHNGTVTNADYLFCRLGLPRYAEVDSEVIFRIADRAVRDGRIDTSMLAKRLSLCRGQMSAVISTWHDPETVIFIKGDRPLEFRYHRRYKVLLYASEDRFLDAVLSTEDGWTEVAIPKMHLIVLSCQSPMDYRMERFHASGLSNGPMSGNRESLA